VLGHFLAPLDGVGARCVKSLLMSVSTRSLDEIARTLKRFANRIQACA
jgi:hypothetical protein